MKELGYLLKIFSDTNRLRILILLLKRRMCVCELAHVLGVTQPSISRHLKRMKQAGFVGQEQDGFWTNYFVNNLNGRKKQLLVLLDEWAKEDKTVKADLNRIKHLNRTKLCYR